MSKYIFDGSINRKLQLKEVTNESITRLNVKAKINAT